MSIPASQKLRIGAHIFSRLLEGKRRFPLVLMLEPLFRCNLHCRGCGKIQHPPEILQRHLTVDECVEAVEECGAPVVSIAGGEPLLHPDIHRIVRELTARKKYVYVCTNSLLVENRIRDFETSCFLIFNIHLDGLGEKHDVVVQRKGMFQKAVKAIKLLLSEGHQVTTNTTVYDDQDPCSAVQLLDFIMSLGIMGMTVAPGFTYDKASDGSHCLRREDTKALFKAIFTQGRDRNWSFNHSSLYLDFLAGNRDYPCAPWGNPARNIFGWQKPCYLLNDGYASSFRELMETTDWEKYGVGKDPRCSNCMIHCGFEPSAVMDSLKHPLKALLVRLRGPGRESSFFSQPQTGV